MKVERIKLIPYSVYQICDCGGTYELNNNNIMLTSFPPQYVHICNKCGDKRSFNKVYPQIEYEEDWSEE